MHPQFPIHEFDTAAFRNLPPATLDESRAPELAVLSRFTEGRMLRGRIERQGDQFSWHFVLDTAAVHVGKGQEPSYELARARLCAALRAHNVTLTSRRDSVLMACHG